MSGEHSAGPEPPVAFVGKQTARMPVREWRTCRQATTRTSASRRPACRYENGAHVGKPRPARRQADDPHVGKRTVRMPIGERHPARQGASSSARWMALVTAARVSIPAGGWMGNAHDAFSFQRKGKRQQLYGRAANHMGSRRTCRLGFTPISAMIAPPTAADRSRSPRHRALRAGGYCSSNFGQAGGDCDSLA
jgi:hypothetical protein